LGWGEDEGEDDDEDLDELGNEVEEEEENDDDLNPKYRIKKKVLRSSETLKNNFNR
jgi:hypothetical protein